MGEGVKSIGWERSFEVALKRAREERREVLVYFHKPNCAGCLRLDTVTYPDPEVAAYIREHLVPCEASMAEREAWPLFRTNHVIWTPSVGVADRNGNMHYLSPGFLPPSDFLSAMRIGRARCLMAWTRAAEAAKELEEAAAVENAMTAEALFWLATAYFLERRDNSRMYETWERLVERFPDSPWAKRTYRADDGRRTTDDSRR